MSLSAAVIGSPVSHSLSPAMHNAAYQELGLDVKYTAIDLTDAEVPNFLEEVRDGAWLGVNVTTPHKQLVSKLVDKLTPSAQALDGVNSVHVVDGQLVGDSTDGRGLIRGIEESFGGVVGKRVVVLGSGAAARSIIFAFGLCQVSEIGILNRTVESARKAAELTPLAKVISDGDVSEADIVVNATSVGMQCGPSEAELPVAASILVPAQLVVDIVYKPIETPLLEAARGLGCKTIDGRSMLLHQACLSIEAWTNKPAPLAVMRSALEL